MTVTERALVLEQRCNLQLKRELREAEKERDRVLAVLKATLAEIKRKGL